MNKHNSIVRLLSGLLALVFCVSLVFGTIGFTAAADADGTITNSALLVKLGIIDASYVKDDAEPITRGEFVRLALCFQQTELGDITDVYFDDVPYDHAMAYHINKAYLPGIVTGYADGSFRPDDTLSTSEAAAIILRALGYQHIAQAKGGYLMTAQSLRLLDGVPLSGKMQYGDAARLLYNVLMSEYFSKTQMMEDGSIQYQANRDCLVLNELFDIYRTTGVLEAVGDFSYIPGMSAGEDFAVIDGVRYQQNGDDIRDYIGQEVTVYYREDANRDLTLMLLQSRGDSRTQVNTEDIFSVERNGSDYTVRYGTDKASKRLTVSAYFDCIYNGRFYQDFDIRRLPDLYDGNVTFVQKGSGQGQYDLLVVNEYRTAVLEAVNYADEVLIFTDMTTYGKETGRLQVPENRLICDTEGIALTLSDLKGGYVVSVACDQNNSYAEIVATNRLEVHALDSVSAGERKVVLDGEEYCLSRDFDMEQNEFLLSDRLPYYIDAFGKVAAMNDKNIESEQYGYLIDCKVTQVFEPEVKLLIVPESGTAQTYAVHKTVMIDGTRIEHAQITAQAKLFQDGKVIPQLVKYKLFNNEIHELHTAVDHSAEAGYQGFDTENFSCDYDAGTASVYLRYSPKVLASKYLIDQTTTIFIVPDDASRYESYEVVKMDYFQTDNSSMTGVQVYDADECRSARIVVMQARSAVSQSNLFVLNYVSRGLDEMGDVVVKLNGYIEGGMKEYPVDETRVNVNELKCGDCMSLTMEKGRVNGVTVLASADNTFSSESNITSNWGIAVGAVYKKTANAITLSYDGNSLSSVVFPVLSTCYVYRYDAKRKSLTTASYGDIIVGSRVVIHRGSDQAKSIVLYE